MDFEKIKADIADLYEECLSSTTPFHRKLDLFIVPNNIVQQVVEITSIDLSNHWVSIDNYGIIHTLQQHGNPLSEARRGQIAVDREDIIKFFEIFLDPDEIKFIGQTLRTKLPLIQFAKIIGDKKYVIKEVRTIESKKKNKTSRIIFHTMYKIKADKT